MKKLRLPLLLIAIFAGIILAASREISAQTDDQQDDRPFISGGLDWGPDGSLLAVGTSQGIYIHDTETLNVTQQLSDSPFVSALDWNRRDNRIVSGHSDGSIQVWNVEDGTLLTTLDGHERVVTSVQWSPDGTQIASGSWDDTLRIWDVDTGQVQVIIHTGAEITVNYSVNWNAAGDQMASQGAHGVYIWDTSTGQPAFSWFYNREVSALKWSPDNEIIATANSSDQILLWDVSTGTILNTLDGGGGFVHAIAWSPDGRRLASHSTSPSDIRRGWIDIWDVATGDLLAHLPDVSMTGDGSYANAIAWSPDGTRLASISDDGRVIIWDMDTYDELASYDEYRSILLPD